MDNNSLPQKTRQRGITLLDLIITLSISAILSTAAVSGLAQFKTNFAASADKNSLLTLVKAARYTAITNNTYTTICHLENNECADFASPLTAFADRNNNKTLNADETIIAIATIDQSATVYWNRNKRIRFEPNGRAGGFNGTLRYCVESKIFKLIISRVGRSRISDADLCD
jgi:type IV fimbrial biogenesis protein FimT